MSGIPPPQFISYYGHSLSGGTLTSGMFCEAGVAGHLGRLVKGFKAAGMREQVSALKGRVHNLLAGHRTYSPTRGAAFLFIEGYRTQTALGGWIRAQSVAWESRAFQLLSPLRPALLFPVCDTTNSPGEQLQIRL